jgi:16S rRNA (uracil1498-N3)-methyltransferase
METTEMHRFYVSREIIGDNFSISDAKQLHHIKDVLRLKVNDEVIVVDTAGNEYTCIITSLNEREVALTIKARKCAGAKKMRSTVACAIPKKADMDEIIDKLTQLGVDSIIPMATERVIVRLDDNKKEARLNRWKRIAQSAAQQSQRNIIPLVEPITTFKSVISHAQDFDLRLIPTLSGERKHIKEVLSECKPGNILVLIGPEGDFTQQEIELARSAGFIPVSLRDSVLRVSTAAIAVMSYIKLALGD